MIALFLLVLFGLGTAYFSTQNTELVRIVFATFPVTQVPLYIIVIGSLLLGIFISWLISLVDAFSSLLSLHGKDYEIKKAQKTIAELQQKNRDLEIEKSRLEGELKGEGKKINMQERNDGEHANLRPSFFQNFQHHFS